MGQGAAEAGKEALTEIASIISDAAVMGQNSEFHRLVQNYMAQGLSETEAKGKAFLDNVGNVVTAGAGGFLSGVLMGGVVNGTGYLTQKAQSRGSSEGQAAAVLQQAMTMPPDSQARQLADRITAQLETKLTELGIDASDLYAMSREEQTGLIEQVMDSVLSDQSVGELKRLMGSGGARVTTAFNSTFDKNSVADTNNSGTIKPTQIVEGHSSTPKSAEPGSVIDHIDTHNKVDIQTFYTGTGMKGTEIHTGNHGNCKTHSFGRNGEHAHEYVWDENGYLISKEPRELTQKERIENVI